MKIARCAAPALLLLSVTTATHAQGPASDAPPAKIAWGKTVDGLQLGLALPAEARPQAAAAAAGSSAAVQVFLRSTGPSPVRLLASVHTCLLGAGGSNSLLVSALVLKPKAGGEPLIVTYQGWNHLSLLDKRRSKAEQPQQTLNNSFGKTDVQLSAEDANRMTTVLRPGETRATDVVFALGSSDSTAWQLQGATSPPAGAYEVTAILKVDQEFSEWKGELTSGPLVLELPPPAAK